MTEATAIVVLGMHRSGTSLVCQIVQNLGVFGGEEEEQLGRDDWNAGGYFEVRKVLDLNQQLLLDHGHDLSLPPIECDHPLAGGASTERRAEGRALVEEYRARSGGVWVWKDPRFSLTLPWWRPLLPRVLVILCLRHPAAIAASLQRRDRFPIARSIKLWEVYLRQALWSSRGLQVLTVDYESVVQDPVGATRRLAAFLNDAGIPCMGEEDTPGLAPLMKKELVHFSSEDDGLLDERQQRLYRSARDGSVDLEDLRRTETECLRHRPDLVELTAQSLRTVLDRREQQIAHMEARGREEREFRRKQFESLKAFCDQQVAAKASLKASLTARVEELEQSLAHWTAEAQRLEADVRGRKEHVEKLEGKLRRLARQNPLQRLLGKGLRDYR